MKPTRPGLCQPLDDARIFKSPRANRARGSVEADVVRVLSDDGMGIGPELCRGSSTFQAGTTVLDRRKGGLGLGWRCKTLVELHAGTIEAASEGGARQHIYGAAAGWRTWPRRSG